MGTNRKGNCTFSCRFDWCRGNYFGLAVPNQFESEFQRQSVGLLRRVVRENWGLFLDGAGLVTLAIVVALLVPKLASGGISNRGLMPESLPTQAATYLLWALAAFAVAGAFWFGFRDKARALVP